MHQKQPVRNRFTVGFDLQKWLKPVDLNQADHRSWVWLALSLGVACYFGGLTLLYTLNHEYIIQDDARQHIVWLQRFVDRQLFPNDWIANYFGAVAPLGFKWLYEIAAQLGIEPIILAKILPLAISCVTSIYLFKVSLHIFPIPFSAFLATLILNQQLWLNDDLTSATPRAFVYPIFAAFLYYLLRQKLFPCLITIMIQGLFFPQLVFVQVLVLYFRLLRYQENTWKLSKQKQDYIFWLAGTSVAGFVLLPFALNLSEFGAVITAAQMQSLPEYGLAGRNEYFGVNPFRFIFFGDGGLRIPLFPSIILAGLGLPFLKRFSLASAITTHVKLLAQIVLASLVMYGLAHLFLMKLHFPNRYTYHTFRIVLSIATGIVLTVLLDAGWRKLQKLQSLQTHARLTLRGKLLLGLTICAALVVLIVPAIPPLFVQFQGWVIGEAPLIYQYLEAQPKDVLTASLAQEANNLPAFSQRSTLVGREFALPHHPKYYAQFQQRASDLLSAQYSSDLSTVIRVINQYDIDFFLVERTAFQPDYLKQDWLIRSSFQDDVYKIIQELEQQSLQEDNLPVMQQLMERCQVTSTQTLVLIQANCLTNSAPTSAPD